MPLIKSLFGPVPAYPTGPPANIHDTWFGERLEPLLLEVPDDFVVYIDAISGRRVVYGEFVEIIRDAATAIATGIEEGCLSVSQNELVGILAENCLEYIILVHALLRVAVPVVLLPTHLTSFELDHVLKVSKPSRIFVSGTLLSQSTPSLARAGVPDDKIYILDRQVEGRRSLGDFISHVRKHRIPCHPVRRPRPDGLAYLIFSSGTSGLPKAVMTTHANLWYLIRQFAVLAEDMSKVMQVPPSDAPVTVLSFLPFYHTYNLHATVFMARRRQTKIIMPRWEPRLFLKMIKKYRVTDILLVPSVIHQIVTSPQFKNADLSSVLRVQSGGAYLPPSLVKKFTSLYKQIPAVGSGYGMSETTLTPVIQPIPGLFGLKPVPGSSGILAAGLEARIIREDESDAEYDEPGEFLLRGGTITPGYYNDPASTNASFLPGGWLRTGDRFSVNRDGLFFYHDRAKDTLKVSAHQVSPKEIEDALLTHPDKLISDAVVAAVDGGREDGEKVPRAWVVPTSEGRALGEVVVSRQLHAWIEKNLSKFKWLRGGIQFIDEIPRNATGKVLRRRLQEEYAKQRTVERARL